MLTPEDIADLLQVDVTKVQEWMENGEIQSVNLDGHWRAAPEALNSFLSKRHKETNIQSLKRVIYDKSRWAKILKNDPEFAQRLKSKEFEKGSIGDFLAQAMEESENIDDSNNVTRLDERRDS